MRGQVTLRVLGSGDPFGSGGRHQSAYLVEAGPWRILLDCGAGTLPGLRRFRIDPAGLDLVLLSHLHGDHVAGLPVIFHAFQHVAPRSRPLSVAGPPGIRGRVESIYRTFYPPAPGAPRRFRVDYRTLPAGRSFRPDGLEGVEVRPFRVHHQAGRENFGYRLDLLGRRLVYTGDTAWFARLAEHARGADLLLCECTHRTGPSPKHLSLAELKSHRRHLQARSILLTHLGPEVVGLKGVPGFRLARDGMKVRV
jgi:ribonuclease BN (tRNA processing enzyme)